MENLPSWVVTIAAVAVGVSPRLAILSTRLIASVLHCIMAAPEDNPYART